MGPRRFAQRGAPLLLPRLFPLLLLLLLLLGLGSDSAEGAAVMERLQDGFGYSYMIHGYALGDTVDYELAPINSACECRRWCQVSASCASVSVVRWWGGVECRVSNRPAVLTNITDRPRLIKTQGATHFLSVATWEAEEVEEEGVEVEGRWYLATTTSQRWGSPSRGCRLAVLTSHSLVLAILPSLSAKTEIFVNLSRPKNSVAEWDADGDAVPYTDTDHGRSRLLDEVLTNKRANFFLSPDPALNYTFVGSSGPHSLPALCVENPLNLGD